jgi:hypothetical protein
MCLLSDVDVAVIKPVIFFEGYKNADLNSGEKSFAQFFTLGKRYVRIYDADGYFLVSLGPKILQAGQVPFYEPKGDQDWEVRIYV